MITSNVKKLMQDKGVTLRKMAMDTGLSQMTLIRARSDMINQSRLYTLEEIAKYLECKVKDLFDES